jgi:pimeloyl-ACP methyl ester carboxylesterase
MEYGGGRMYANIPLVLVPCFSGAPWNTVTFAMWRNRKLITGQFQDVGSMDNYADVVANWTKGLDDYILVGDSFGASVSLALAQRQPPNLRALVISGGFAKADVSLFTKFRVLAGKLLGQVGYLISVFFHVQSLGSKYDPPGTAAELRDLFLKHTDAKTFIHRGEMILKADLRPGLKRVKVPTLILTPEDDRLIGPLAAKELIEGIPGAEERVLPHTGHLLRFTHEQEYAVAVDEFLARRLGYNGKRRVKQGSRLAEH